MTPVPNRGTVKVQTDRRGHDNPKGFNIRSRISFVALSPPFCNATAPTIANSA